MATVHCERCGGEISGARSDVVFCSNRCRQAAYRERDGLLSSDNVEIVIASNPDIPAAMASLLREAVTDRERRRRNGLPVTDRRSDSRNTDD